MTSGPGGRPSKFTPEAKEKILYAISKGSPYELACNYARVSYSAFNKWRLKAAAENEPELVEFFDEVKEAEGRTAIKWLEKIDQAMDEGLWTAAAWKLERRHNKYFSAQAGLIEMNERLDKLEGIKLDDDRDDSTES